MPLYSDKEFAALTVGTTAKLATYKGRKKVVSVDGVVDSSNPVNAAFFEKHSAKLAIKKATPATGVPLPKKKVKVIPADAPKSKTTGSKKIDKLKALDAEQPEDEADDSDTELMGYAKSEKSYQHWRAKKTENDAILKEKEIARLEGSLLPVDLVTPLFQQHNTSIVQEFKVLMEEQMRNIAKKYTISLEDQAAARGKLNTGLTEAIARAKTATFKKIKNIIDDYAGSQ